MSCRWCGCSGTIGEIRNGYDKVIGAQCNVCMAILWALGKCHGCTKDPARLTCVREVDGKTRRYCSEFCRREELGHERADASAKLKREQEAAKAAKAARFERERAGGRPQK